MADRRKLKVRNQRIKFAAKSVNWLAVFSFVAGIAGQLIVSDFSLVVLLLLLGFGVALHVIALVIVGHLVEEV